MSPLLHDLLVFGAGTCATLICAFVAQRTGFIQISLMKEAGIRDRLRTEPKVRVRLSIDTRQPNGPSYPAWHYLWMEIYNEGELAVRDIKGQCSVSSSIEEVQKFTCPFHHDFLGKIPAKIETGQLIGTTVADAMRARCGLNFQVEVDFRYETGIPKDQPQNYKAKYNFDSNSRTLIKET